MAEVDICENLKKVNTRIQKACAAAGRDPKEVTLIAVSKTKPLDDVVRAAECGQLHFGENKAQELTAKLDELDERGIQLDVQWHMIGSLQTNKIKYLAGRTQWLDSIPKKKGLKELEKRASREEVPMNTMIQVNISGEGQKSGCDPDQLPALLEYAQDLEYEKLRGLMGIATLTDDTEQIRSEFRMLRELRDQYRDQYGGSVQLDELSMGMTSDLEIAIEEGATMVRVGTAIFGARDYG